MAGASPRRAPDWDAMRESLLATCTLAELRAISKSEDARCAGGAKVDVAAGIVANRRRVYLDKKRPMDPWRAGYKSVCPAYTSPYCGHLAG